MTRRRLLILTHYYAPEVGAPQTRLHETALRLRGLGWDVSVVTGPPHYPTGRVAEGYTWWRPATELRDGIPVTRLPMIARPNVGFLDRVVDQASLATTALASAAIVRSADLFLVESPPLFLGATAYALKVLARRPYVFHVADPWPDFPIAIGALGSPFAQRLAYRLERVAYSGAALVTTVTPGLVRRLEAKSGARGKVRLLPNGVDTSRFDPEADPVATRAMLGWPEARLTIVYVGTVGLAQGVLTLIDAAAPLAGQGVVVHIVGNGADVPTIRERIHSRRIENVHLWPAVPASDIPRILAAADVAAVLLREGPLYDESLPTKLLEGLAAGRPLLISAGGETAALVREGGAGGVAPPEDAAALREVIAGLITSPDRTAMGRAARRLAQDRFDRDGLATLLASYLDEAMRSATSA